MSNFTRYGYSSLDPGISASQHSEEMIADDAKELAEIIQDAVEEVCGVNYDIQAARLIVKRIFEEITDDER